ncbi:MAG: hypothetical protein ACKVS6_03095 [Planctomycetota bacterium]
MSASAAAQGLHGFPPVADPCAGKPVYFYSSYGDENQTFDGSTGISDLLASYAPAVNFSSWIASLGATQNTDNAANLINVSYPFILKTYQPYGDIKWATLRFDIYFDQNQTAYETDVISIFDEANNRVAASYNFGTPLRDKLILLNKLNPRFHGQYSLFVDVVRIFVKKDPC